MPVSQNKFELGHKLGMINLWRERCDKLSKTPEGISVDQKDCKICNDLVKEIEEELKELQQRREEEMKPPSEKVS